MNNNQIASTSEDEQGLYELRSSFNLETQCNCDNIVLRINGGLGQAKKVTRLQAKPLLITVKTDPTSADEQNPKAAIHTVEPCDLQH